MSEATVQATSQQTTPSTSQAASETVSQGVTDTQLLSTTYLGLPLAGPMIASAGPLTGRRETLVQLQNAGAAAVVLPSLFEEEVIAEEMAFHESIEQGAESFGEFTHIMPEVPMPDLGPARHVRLVEEAKAALTVPVIASVNAAHPGSWSRYAGMLQDAGADAIELNVYAVAADHTRSGADIEQHYLEIISEVKSRIAVPLAVKLAPFFSSFSHFASRAVNAGADGLVLFNRFYAPDIDLDTLSVTPTVELSHSDDLRLPLRWIGILRPQLPDTSIAATSGIHSGADMIKALLAGATVACTTSAVVRNGPGHITSMLAEATAWLREHDYTSVNQLRGAMSAQSVDNPGDFERSQYISIITSMGLAQ